MLIYVIYYCNMVYLLSEKICRTCTKVDSELSSLFCSADMSGGVCYSEMLMESIQYSIQQEDALPNLICAECRHKLKVAYDFKKQCEESHKELLNMILSIKQSQEHEHRESSSNVYSHCVTLVDPAQEEPVKEEITTFEKLSCSKCTKAFDTVELLDVHTCRKSAIKKHTCPKCSKEFIRLGHLTRHMNKLHRTQEPQQEKNDIGWLKNVDQVNKSNTLENISRAESLDDLDADPGMDGIHSQTESEEEKEDTTSDTEINNEPTQESELKPESIIYDVPVVTKNSQDVIKVPHEDTKHTQEGIFDSSKNVIADASRKFQCEQCHKAFKRKSHLKQHLLCHTKVKPYQCTICQKSFGRPDNLKVHMAHHGQKQFQCNTCDRSFVQAYLLKRHKDQTHSEEKPFLCSECGQRFGRNGDLAVHMRRHTGEKPYKCQYCDKGFTRSTEVYVHERYHTGEKRHVCSICGKGFQRPYNLLVHVRTHTGERPYQCPHCPKNFAQCSDLKSHIRRHTGERYRCDQCGKGFIHVFVLNQHKFSVHGIEVQSRIKRVAKLTSGTQ